ncbi:MAG: hypothetical protein IT445_07430 [Phycisphaeraceae bacterium]|nr:hypothetical protein [Phycisphaeraceae bacterium]
MNKAIKSRLNRVTDRLDHCRIAQDVWLTVIDEHESCSAFVTHCRDQRWLPRDEVTRRLGTLTDQPRSHGRRVPSQHRDPLDLQRLWREAHFVICLGIHCELVTRRHAADHLEQVPWLRHQVDWLEVLADMVVRGPDAQTPTNSRAILRRVVMEWRLLRAQVHTRRQELETLTGTMRRIGERYFRGCTPLFRETRLGLDEVRDQLTDLACRLAGELATDGAPLAEAPPIPMVEPVVQAYVEGLMRLARAEVVGPW